MSKVNESDKPATLYQLVKSGNTSGIIEYMQPVVNRLAATYHIEQGALEVRDLASVGYVAIAETLDGIKRLRHRGLGNLLEEAAEKAIKGAVLTELVEQNSVVYASEVSEAELETYSDTIDYFEPVDLMVDFGFYDAPSEDSLPELKDSSPDWIGKDISYFFQMAIKSDDNPFTHDKDAGVTSNSQELDYQSQIQGTLAQWGSIAIDAWLYTISHRERLSLKLKYGIRDGYTFSNKDIGALFKVTSSRAGQIILTGLQKLYLPQRQDIIRPFIPLICSNQKPYRFPSLPDKKSQKEELEELSELYDSLALKIEELTGDEVGDFKEKYFSRRSDFAGFLMQLYPRLKKKKALKLVELSTEEKKYAVIGTVPSGIKKQASEVKSTIERLEKEMSAPKSPLQREIDSYRAAFLLDSETCVAELREKQEQEGADNELLEEVIEHYQGIAAVEVEGLNSELDDYQKMDVAVLRGHDQFIIGSEMGVGKTLEAIAYAQTTGSKRVLVISTKSSAYSTWPSELEKHLAQADHRILDGSSIRGGNISDARWNITTFDIAAGYPDELNKQGYDLIILDECHNINNSNTQRSQSVTRLRSPRKLAVSGSLFKNKRSELFPVLNWLWPAEFPSLDSFVRTYCMTERGMYRLRYELAQRMVYHSKDSVLDLPEVLHHKEIIAMSRGYRARYNAIERNFVEWLRSKKEIQEKIPAMAFGKLHALREAAILPKIVHARDIAYSVLGENPERKLAIYTEYLGPFSTIDKKMKRKYKGVTMQGQDSPQARAKRIRQFHEDPETRYIVLTRVGGESVNLTAADAIIFLNKPLTHAGQQQAIDRLHRRGQEKEVEVFHTIVSDTVEEKIEDLIAHKAEEYKRTVKDAFTFFEEADEDTLSEIIKSLVA